MTKLANFQAKMALSVLQGKLQPELSELIVAGPLSAMQRLQIYQNNYSQSLVEGLCGVYPVVGAYVGADFLKQALKKFVRENAPKKPMLHLYGADLAAFLDAYQPAQSVPYIGDMARLEWAVHSLQFRAETVMPTGPYELCLSHIVIQSEFPLLNLWLAGTGQLPPEAVSLQAGGQIVVAFLRNRTVRFVTLDASEAESFEFVLSGGVIAETHRASLIEKGLMWEMEARDGR